MISQSQNRVQYFLVKNWIDLKIRKNDISNFFKAYAVDNYLLMFHYDVN